MILYLKNSVQTINGQDQEKFFSEFVNKLENNKKKIEIVAKNVFIFEEKILTIVYVNKKYCPIHDVPIILELKKNDLKKALVINFINGNYTFKEINI